jgi:hypothetical protein
MTQQVLEQDLERVGQFRDVAFLDGVEAEYFERAPKVSFMCVSPESCC